MLSISAGQNVRTLKPELAFALGRLAKDEEQIDVAETFLRAALATPDPKVRSRAQAHLAHLHYYRGLFVEGLELATRALTGAAGLARLEANLYASVNAIALNRSAQALLLAERARRLLRTVMDRVLRDDARLRVSRQLVHVYVARGEYLRATAEAEAATGRRDASGRSEPLAPRLICVATLPGHAVIRPPPPISREPRSCGAGGTVTSGGGCSSSGRWRSVTPAKPGPPEACRE